jgi:hypothetical protein
MSEAEEIQAAQVEGFEAVLAAMPRIAAAVKAFPEAVQPQAYETLIAELRGNAAPSPRGAGGAAAIRATPKAARRRPKRTTTASTSAKTEPTRRRAGGPTVVRDLDLTPKGKKSLKEFVAEKQPKSNHDRNAVSVYYLIEVLRGGAVSVDQVFTCYKDMRWREPGDLANSLALTAHRKRFLDTARLDDIKLTPAGRNHVEHDLPAQQQKKKS